MAHNIVTGALAVIKDSTGLRRYYYQGTVLPEDLPAAEIERLTELGLVGEIKDPLAPLPEPLAAPVVAEPTPATNPTTTGKTPPAKR